VPSGIELLAGGHGEALRVVTAEAATLIAPVFPGDELRADFHWTDRKQRLVVRWPAGAAAPAEMFLEPEVREGRPREVSDAAQRLCACHIEVHAERECEVAQGWPTGECTPTCINAYGEPTAECLATYGEDCAALLRCARGDPLSLPACPAGSVNAGATGQCRVACSDTRPCASGSCAPWQGTGVCVTEGAGDG
jgi:hypothetical protein